MRKAVAFSMGIVLAGLGYWPGAVAETIKEGQSSAVREKIASPIQCRLEWAQKPDVGEEGAFRLEVESRNLAGEVQVELDIPEPLRSTRSASLPRRAAFQRGQKREWVLPLQRPDAERRSIRARVVLTTPEGARISTGASLIVGPTDAAEVSGRVFHATSSKGLPLRVHRIDLSPQSKGNEQ